MIEPSHRIESLYQSFSKFRSILRENYPRDSGLLLSFYSSDINTYNGLEEQLVILDKGFTAYFGMGDYRNLIEVIRLACFIKIGGIGVKKTPIIFQLNFNSITSDFIHHDNGLTPIILSQLPYPEDFSYGEGNYGADVETKTIMIELGDTFVHKVFDGLNNGYNEVWVVPIYRENKIKNLESIYKFTRGSNWDDTLWWKEKEQFDDDEERRQVISSIFERT